MMVHRTDSEGTISFAIRREGITRRMIDRASSIHDFMLVPRVMIYHHEFLSEVSNLSLNPFRTLLPRFARDPYIYRTATLTETTRDAKR